MTERVSTVLELVGLALVAFAAFLVFVPAGVLVAGLACVLIGYQLGGDDVDSAS